ncbi:MAG TPA: hypothetical protein VH437_13780 [Terriglobales bacterium]
MMRPADIDVVLPSNALERDAMESVVDRLTALFEGATGVRGGLYLASTDAGNATTQRFWHDAMAAGVALANPELFPWCLANAPCAALARRFGIAGPNFTWLGGEDALQAAWHAAESALARNRVDNAFVVFVEFGKLDLPGRFQSWRLQKQEIRRGEERSAAALLS